MLHKQGAAPKDQNLDPCVAVENLCAEVQIL